MKKIFCFMIVLLIGISCNKDSESADEPLINRVTVNGGIAYKFFYNSANQVTRWELYGYESPGNPLNSVIEFKYNSDDKLSELSSYNEPGNIPGVRILFEYDNQGRIVGHERYDLSGPNPSEPDLWGVYMYNAENRLSSVTIRDENDNLDTRYNFTYFDNGLLKQRESYEETVTNQLRLTGRVIFSLPLDGGIKGWEPITVIPLDGDEIIRTVRYDAIQRYIYNNGVLTSNKSELISAREYNADGTLKRHVFTRKSIVPAFDDVVMNWEFEYLHQ